MATLPFLSILFFYFFDQEYVYSNSTIFCPLLSASKQFSLNISPEEAPSINHATRQAWSRDPTTLTLSFLSSASVHAVNVFAIYLLQRMIGPSVLRTRQDHNGTSSRWCTTLKSWFGLLNLARLGISLDVSQGTHLVLWKPCSVAMSALDSTKFMKDSSHVLISMLAWSAWWAVAWNSWFKSVFVHICLFVRHSIDNYQLKVCNSLMT